MNLEKIYEKSPIWLQKLFVSAYGFARNRTQRGRKYFSSLTLLNRNLLLTKSEMAEKCSNSLQKMLVNAYQNVPYYKDLFDKNNISINKINSKEEFKKIPLLKKNKVQTINSDLINNKIKKELLSSINTSGTTGTPLKIYFDNESRQVHYSYFSRFLKTVNLNPNGRKATLGGRVIVPVRQKKPPFWRYNYFSKDLMLSLYHLTDENIPFYINKLRKYRPEYIDAYPSGIFQIAKFMKQQGIKGDRLTKGIVTSAECLTEDQRKVIEDVFNVPIFDQYGCAEMSIFVGQCVHQNYHIHTDYGFVEFLTKTGEDAKPGEAADIVCSGFVNPVMPFIRYKIGDRCVYSERSCPCGSPFPVIDKILGRSDDVIITSEGKKISRIGAVLYELPVKEVQYVQKEKGKLEIHIVKDNAYFEDTEKKIIQRLEKRLGTNMEFVFVYETKIKRGPGGKLKTIVSLVTSEP